MASMMKDSVKQLDEIITLVEGKKEQPPKEEKKPQEPKPKQAAKPAAKKNPVELDDFFHTCALQVLQLIPVSQIKEAKPHPEADKLLLTKIDVGKGEERQLIAGIIRWYKPETVVGKQIITILNLKPSKLKGLVSEAMLLAGSHVRNAEADDRDVVVLCPPEGSEVGDRVYLEGYEPDKIEFEWAQRCNEKVWEKVGALLEVKGGFATFNGKKLRTNKGFITVPGLADGSHIK